MNNNEPKDQFNEPSGQIKAEDDTPKVPQWSTLEKIHIQLDAIKAVRGGRGTRTTRGYYTPG